MLTLERWIDTFVETNTWFFGRVQQAEWLERGAVAAIIDALTAELLNKPFAQHIKASLNEAKEILVGPESLYSEWNDFKTVLRLMQYRLLSENPRLSRVLSDVQSSGPR
jgi:hypothetical protein